MVCCKCCRGYALLCRVFAHAWLWAAVILSGIAVGSCSFVTRGRGEEQLAVGLFRFERPGSECVPYRNNGDLRYGWVYDWARLSGLLAPLFGVLLVGLMFVDCCCRVCCSKCMQAGLLFCCMLCQGFTFLIYASNVCISRKGLDQTDQIVALCRIGGGSISSFSAFWCYFVGAILLCCSPKPDPMPCCKEDDDVDNDDCYRKSKKEKDMEEDAPPTAPVEEQPAAQRVDSPVKEGGPVEEKTEEGCDVFCCLVPPEVADQSKEKEEVRETGDVPDEERPEEARSFPDEGGSALKAADGPGSASDGAASGQTQEPDESGMEVEFDEEFGTSQVKVPLED